MQQSVTTELTYIDFIQFISDSQILQDSWLVEIGKLCHVINSTGSRFHIFGI